MRKKFSYIEDKTAEELRKDIDAVKIELLTLRMQHARSALKNPLLLRQKRRIVARMCMMLSMKEREVKGA